MKEKEAF